MRYQCKYCQDIIQSNCENPFVSCKCNSIFVDSSYYKGESIMTRMGFKNDINDIIEFPDLNS